MSWDFSSGKRLISRQSAHPWINFLTNKDIFSREKSLFAGEKSVANGQCESSKQADNCFWISLRGVLNVGKGAISQNPDDDGIP